MTGTQVWQALAEILPRTYLDGVGVTVRVGDVPQYVLCVSKRPNVEWGDALDRRLQALNSEYESKRRSARLKPLVVNQVPDTVFQEHTRQRRSESVADGQGKDDIFLPFALVAPFIPR